MEVNDLKKKLVSLLTALLLCVSAACMSACGGDTMTDMRRGMDDYSFTKASFSATDRVGRKITPMHKEKTDHERYVGVFYFLWLGTHLSSAGVYDVTKLQKTAEGAAAVFDASYRLGQKVPNTVNAEEGYPDGMESPTNYVHWTNEPLYGYYNTADDWVVARHMELLTMAGVDFIFFDTTNEYDYAENEHTGFVSDPSDPKNVQLSRPTYAVLDTILELSDQGWDVPQVVFYTNNKSGERVKEIYEDFYASGKYDSIWFAPFGKPMIVGTTDKNKGTDQTGDNRVDISADMQEYFDVRESQWPNQASQSNGFPWMDWSEGNQNFYFEDNKVMNVNVAQHGSSETSYSAYTHYGRPADGRSSRGWNEAEFSIDEDWESGKNIEDQWDSVFRYEENGKEVEMVTVSAWNEWLAWKYNPAGDSILYVDNFNNQFSRDLEMDRDYYQDNFYLQLVRNVRKYKYGAAKDDYEWEEKTVSSLSDFDKVQAKYKDFVGDARVRDFYGFDIRTGSKEANLLGSWYTDTSNRNDIVETAIVHDGKNVYLRIQTKDDITPYAGGENWMNVLVKTKASTAENSWEGYNFIINRAPVDGKASVDMSVGGWNWKNVGAADMKIEKNQMMITIPLAMLGLSAENFAFEFKVADNVTQYTDIMDYYISGDSAPIGRLNYAYGY